LDSKTASLGPKGEARAEKYLIRQGYSVLKRNERVGGVEFDLIARKGDTLCLVEVKSRRSDAFGFPEEFVDAKKRKRMIRGAKLLASRKAFRDLQIRFDVISVLFRGKEVEINHIEHAFEQE
jgi:putative endonuclease